MSDTQEPLIQVSRLTYKVPLKILDKVRTVYHTKILRKAICEDQTKDYKTILRNININFYPGEFVAIVGGSGCGKTTMLSLVAGRLRTGWMHGDVKLNGKTVGAWSKRLIGYVAQEDTLHPLDTPREVINFSASCSRKGWSHNDVVDELISHLGLETCKDTKIGGSDPLDAGGTAKVGLSGGEKRRVSVARELARPGTSILLLDECTSGLDVRNAEKLIHTLKNLTLYKNKNQKPLAVIATIHQPSSVMWKLFDRIIVMDAGRVVYDASPKNFDRHMAQIGISLPSSTNPADFLVSAIKDEETGKELQKKLIRLTQEDKIAKAAHEQLKYWKNQNINNKISILPTKSLSIDHNVQHNKGEGKDINMSNDIQLDQEQPQYVYAPQYNTHIYQYTNNNPQSGFIVKQKQNIQESQISASLTDNQSIEAITGSEIYKKLYNDAQNMESIHNEESTSNIEYISQADQIENGSLQQEVDAQQEILQADTQKNHVIKADFYSQPDVDLTGLNTESPKQENPQNLTLHEKAKIRYMEARLDPQRMLHSHIFISLYELFHAKVKYPQGYWKQYALLQIRNYKHLYRSPILPIRFAITYTIQAFFSGSLFWRISHEMERIQTLIGALYFMQMIVSFPLSSEAASQVFRHRQEFLRDHASGTYGTAPWLISLIVTDMPIYLGSVVYFTLIGYYMIGFNDNFGRYMMFLILMMFLAYSIISYAMFWTAATQSLTTSHVFLMATMSILITFSGGFIAMGEIPSYWSWMPWVSVFSYAFRALMYTVFYGNTVACSPELPSCPNVLEKFGLGGYSLVGAYFLGLGFMSAWILGFMTLTYFFLRYKRFQ